MESRSAMMIGKCPSLILGIVKRVRFRTIDFDVFTDEGTRRTATFSVGKLAKEGVLSIFVVVNPKNTTDEIIHNARRLALLAVEKTVKASEMDLSIEIILPIGEDKPEYRQDPLEHLRADLSCMQEADLIIFEKDCEYDRITHLEYLTCKNFSLPHIKIDFSSCNLESDTEVADRVKFRV